MNNKRRKELENIKSKLNGVISDLQGVLSDEEYAFDSMPENLQNSMRGMDSEDAINCMTDAESELDSAIDSIQNAIDILDDVL